MGRQARIALLQEPPKKAVHEKALPHSRRKRCISERVFSCESILRKGGAARGIQKSSA